MVGIEWVIVLINYFFAELSSNPSQVQVCYFCSASETNGLSGEM
jgi:hypothetical protein